MKKIILDSSIFIKLFVKESDSDDAKKFIKKIIANESKILVPELFFYEILATISRDNNLDHKNISAILEEYRENLTTIPLLQKLSLDAINITKHGSPKSGYPAFYDCVYHALAIQEKCTFITADEKHFNKTHKKFGHIKLLKNT